MISDTIWQAEVEIQQWLDRPGVYVGEDRSVIAALLHLMSRVRGSLDDGPPIGSGGRITEAHAGADLYEELALLDDLGPSPPTALDQILADD